MTNGETRDALVRAHLDVPRTDAHPVDRPKRRDLDVDELIAQNLDLPKRVARWLHRRFEQYVELDELIALGNLGLAEAAARFDESRGVKFSTFAKYRVQGAILDAIRSATNLPRGQWKRLTALREASHRLEERAAACSLEDLQTTRQLLEEVQGAIADVRTFYVETINDLSNRRLPCEQPDPVAALDRARLLRCIPAAVATLPPREQLVVQQHYWLGRDDVEAGEALGLHKSSIGRIHSRAVTGLRAWFGTREHQIDAASAAPLGHSECAP